MFRGLSAAAHLMASVVLAVSMRASKFYLRQTGQPANFGDRYLAKLRSRRVPKLSTIAQEELKAMRTGIPDDPFTGQ